MLLAYVDFLFGIIVLAIRISILHRTHILKKTVIAYQEVALPLRNVECVLKHERTLTSLLHFFHEDAVGHHRLTILLTLLIRRHNLLL